MIDEHDDEDLRRALRDASADAGASEALQARVMAQWRAAHGTPAQFNGQRTLRWSAALRWWAGAAGLALCAAVAVTLWLQRPDPALEELMQPDVLSQMVAGEF